VFVERLLSHRLAELGMSDVDYGRFLGSYGRDLYERLGEPMRVATGWSPIDVPEWRAGWFELQGLRRAAVLSEAPTSSAAAHRAVALARSLSDMLRARSIESSTVTPPEPGAPRGTDGITRGG